MPVDCDEPCRPLPAALLYRPCDPRDLPFEVISELENPSGPIGQDRAVEAVEFAVQMRRKGYNIYALGPSGTGKHTLIEDLLRRHADGMPTPSDCCYVNNFADPQKPRHLQLPPGRAVALRDSMKRLVDELRAALPAAFERDDYRARRDVIDQQFRARNEQAFGELQRRAEQQGITLLRTPMGLALASRRDGKVLTPEMFEALPEAERGRIQHDLEEVQGELEAVMQKVPQWEREHREAVRELNRETTGAAIALMMKELRTGYRDLPNVAQYFDAVERDIKENADHFLPSPQPRDGMPMPAGFEDAVSEARFRRYEVNVIVDNGGQRGAPVIYEDNPTHQTLVGRVEHIARFGTLVTDFNLLTPGALHRANGGYLVLDAQRLLAGNFGWASLKRALNAGEIRIETLEQLLSLASTASLQPEPIPLDAKVLLLGPPLVYYLLSALDDDFKELFKIAAGFDDRVERTPETTLLYARFIAGVVRREKLLPFDRSAVARAIEHASRVVGDAERLSTGLRGIVDLLQEADQVAASAGKQIVTAAEVQRAIDAQFDGVFVLHTNAGLNPLQTMLRYKQLWTVEAAFRTAKHLFATRPIHHKLDETICGYVFCSFLALLLKSALDDRIAALGEPGSWPAILADLDSLTETEIERDGARFRVRSAPRPAASLAFRAASIALPPTIQTLSA